MSVFLVLPASTVSPKVPALQILKACQAWSLHTGPAGAQTALLAATQTLLQALVDDGGVRGGHSEMQFTRKEIVSSVCGLRLLFEGSE